MIQKIFRYIYRWFYAINPNNIKEKNVFCPCCGWSGKSFLPFGYPARKNVQCPRCQAVERHRLYYLFLKKYLDEKADKKLKVLHISPEKSLTKLFKSYQNIEYLSIDIKRFKAQKKEDLQNLSFKNNTFDLIFCSHVLEHIKNDRKALQEIYRVLNSDGLAIIQVPIKDIFRGEKVAQTIEDRFDLDQPDHCRVYGRDFYQRLQKVGFRVKIDKTVDRLKASQIKKQVLMPNDKNISPTEGWINLCSK